MALLLAPFFLPLILIGWVFPADDERELQAEEEQREREFAETWAHLLGPEALDEPE